MAQRQLPLKGELIARCAREEGPFCGIRATWGCTRAGQEADGRGEGLGISLGGSRGEKLVGMDAPHWAGSEAQMGFMVG